MLDAAIVHSEGMRCEVSMVALRVWAIGRKPLGPGEGRAMGYGDKMDGRKGATGVTGRHDV